MTSHSSLTCAQSSNSTLITLLPTVGVLLLGWWMLVRDFEGYCAPVLIPVRRKW